MRRRRILQVTVMMALVTTLAVPAAGAGGAQVTMGEFATLSGGAERGYEITGQAVMVRIPSNEAATRIRVTVQGLDPSSTYKVHVHNAPCSGDPAGGGHYQNVVGGPVDAVNEIWPTVMTNPSGVGIGSAAHAAWARPDAQSVVIHWPNDSSVRLACADLN